MPLVGLWVLLAEAHAQPLVPEANSGSLRALMFHVHKAGGTTLCHMAKRNGESISSNNCNVGDKGTPFGWGCDREQAAALSSEAEASYLSSAPYTFGANECLPPREPEAGVLTLTALAYIFSVQLALFGASFFQFSSENSANCRAQPKS